MDHLQDIVTNDFLAGLIAAVSDPITLLVFGLPAILTLAIGIFFGFMPGSPKRQRAPMPWGMPPRD